MPLYNAASYIPFAIESVIQQTYKDFELIIVDDCSTDNSYEIANAYSQKDSRIRLFQLKQNSGSAQKARNYAERQSTGDYIVSLDADDYWEPNYISKLLFRLQETNSDCVISQLICIKDDGCIISKNPTDEFDKSPIISGRDAFSLTLNGWEINGLMLLKRTIAEKANTIYYVNDNLINADELLTRKRFLCCNSVAFSDAQYYYRINNNSITRKISTKYFGYIDTSKMLVNIAEQEFGYRSFEYQKAELQLYNTLRNCSHWYAKLKKQMNSKEKIHVYENIVGNWNNLDFKLLNKNFSFKSRLINILGIKVILNYLILQTHVREMFKK